MIDFLLDNLIKFDRVVIISDIPSKESLTKLLKLIMNYLGEDEYIEHTDDTELFEDFLILNKDCGKRIVSTSLNIWLSNTHITKSTFCYSRWILPYRNMMKISGLPHFPSNKYSIPTQLTRISDLILTIDNNMLGVIKSRYGNFDMYSKMNLNDLFLDERNMKIKKLQQLIS
jgi:hypothetical protein